MYTCLFRDEGVLAGGGGIRVVETDVRIQSSEGTGACLAGGEALFVSEAVQAVSECGGFGFYSERGSPWL